MRTFLMVIYFSVVFTVFTACTSQWNFFRFSDDTSVWEINDPYEKVDWASHNRYKANFHTHTTRSDGRMNPQTVVDKYHELGYHILSITDHNEVTYPWAGFANLAASNTTLGRMESDPETMPANLVYENRDPVVLGMIDIQANELSSHHHMGSFFNDHNGTTTEIESLDATAAKDGITMLYHPGRYNNPTEWYVDLFQSYDHLIGMEVYNQGDRYPYDRIKWDSILTVTMPDRPVWGYSNDDMHSLPHVGRNWNVLILPELTHQSVRYGMENGLSYFIFSPDGHDGIKPPVINSVKVDERKGTIEITSTGSESVRWISNGEVISHGSIIDLNDFGDSYKYVRAELLGSGETITGTQPFGIIKTAK